MYRITWPRKLRYKSPSLVYTRQALLGRAGGNQTLVDRLKADYSIIELQPQIPISPTVA